MYERHFTAGWADMDANAHMRNSAFLDRCSDTRFSYFADHGFSAEEFVRQRIGPVVRSDTIEYRREVRLLDALRVTLELTGMAPDGSRMRLRNNIYGADGTLAVQVTSVVGWLSLDARKLMAPPPALLEALNRITRTDDFEELPSSVRGR
jgi:acyl-CoA thioester hydrolase